MSDPKTMFVFPGQGSQYAGMGSDLHAEFPVVEETYAEASEALGYDIAQLSFQDPKGEIGLTRYTQPCLMTHQIACLRVFNELTGGQVQACMAGGHSLGEYTALVAAGSLSLSDGLRLVKTRGELMGEHGEGGMLALTVDRETAREIADKFYCQVATCNLPEQTVVGGRRADLEALTAFVAEHYPRKRAVPLATEGAFHTYFMAKAAMLFREVLDTTEFKLPKFHVLSNYTAGVHAAEPGSIRTRLFFQLFSPVNWVGCLTTAFDEGIERFIEFGGGLGKGDGPGDKRPNLESIIKKSARVGRREVAYVGAINLSSLREAANSLAG